MSAVLYSVSQCILFVKVGAAEGGGRGFKMDLVCGLAVAADGITR